MEVTNSVSSLPFSSPTMHCNIKTHCIYKLFVFQIPKIPYNALKLNLDTQKPKDLNTDCNIIVTYVTK